MGNKVNDRVFHALETKYGVWISGNHK
ncbi:uncharacterized protein G2W53_002118 [Senna tora]|uniref:Uncharacterized protein n=1 Tax=Senna tora TaxID=362788 RepID=A0A834XH10_9FABA|nr:uncharacterized protein G2W53_002118 [Senna tora]